jgi:hypothetical protein
MSILDSPIEVHENSFKKIIDMEFCELSPKLEDNFEIFEHIQGFCVAIITSPELRIVLGQN